MDAVKAALIGSGVAAFGIVAAFAGGWINQRMSRNTQREQWSRDTRMQECRELLNAIVIAHQVALRISRDTDPREMAEPGYFLGPSEAELESFRVLHTRIIIAEDVKRESIRQRWTVAMAEFRKSDDHTLFSKRFGSISEMIVWIATKLGPKPPVVP